MRRPALTRKVIDNLDALVGFAEGEMENLEDAGLFEETKGGRAAIEWIRKVSRWKREQEGKARS